MLRVLYRVFVIVLLFPTGYALAQSTAIPSSMMVEVTVSASSDNKLIPRDTDFVVVLNSTNAVEEGSAQITKGTALLLMSKSSSLNGTRLLLRLKRGTQVLALLQADGSDAAFSYNGSFLPVRQAIAVTASSAGLKTDTGSGTGSGTGTSSGSGTTSGTGTSTGSGSGTGTITSVPGDVNGDGVVDHRDVAALRDALSGKAPINITRMDINGDGVVNTRDLIELIRYTRGLAQPSAVPVAQKFLK